MAGVRITATASNNLAGDTVTLAVWAEDDPGSGRTRLQRIDLTVADIIQLMLERKEGA